MSYRYRQAIPRDGTVAGQRLLFQYDPWLIGTIVLLLGTGLVMVASASITVADRQHGEPMYYFWRQSVSVAIGIGFAIIIMKVPLEVWRRSSAALLALGFFFLLLVLVPGIGYEVNGSMRWIRIGPVALQASEPAKFCVIAYLAGYMVRHGLQVRESFAGFIKPIIVLTLISALLLLEPDYGAAVVMFATALGMLFMGGVPLSRFFAWVLTALAALASLAILSPYRMQRLVSFIDPWQDPYNSGFQLTQALIAFGRGNWSGAGLGGSIQKLFYLPEAHTDFVFAVIAEELGLIGSLFIIALFCFLVWRAFVIGHVAELAGKQFAAYFAYGIGLLIGTQAFINIGVNMGVLPTKGLTLPLMSYGGNSIIVTCALLAVLLRVEFENRQVRRPFVPEKSDVYAT
ncbi:MAG TPA: putative lipid II flippase FtsW [Gammaproteobacteria bacterium]|nr:putative lipid II flippase FtsW [Gammaproteobacteria bacterium]